MAPIQDAARDGDTEALRRELERGVSPDAPDEITSQWPPLSLAVANKHADCVRLLLQTGADPNVNREPGTTDRFTALHAAAFMTAYSDRAFDIIRLLLEAGASVNLRTVINGWSRSGWTAMDYAYGNDLRVYPLLLRAGSELPTVRIGQQPLSENRYFSRILDAGSFKNYERAHLAALAKTLSPKLTHLLPPELVRKVVEFYLHAGFYPFTEVPAAAPTA